jgi:hypothetical protein
MREPCAEIGCDLESVCNCEVEEIMRIVTRPQAVAQPTAIALLRKDNRLRRAAVSILCGLMAIIECMPSRVRKAPVDFAPVAFEVRLRPRAGLSG